MDSKPEKSAPAKKKPYTPVDDSLAMLRRCIRSIGKKVGRSDPEHLTKLVQLQYLLEDAVVDAVAGLRGDGFTWESIGKALGTTRQAALMRFGERVRTTANQAQESKC
jgi:hypothetical protein